MKSRQRTEAPGLHEGCRQKEGGACRLTGDGWKGVLQDGGWELEQGQASNSDDEAQVACACQLLAIDERRQQGDRQGLGIDDDAAQAC